MEATTAKLAEQTPAPTNPEASDIPARTFAAILKTELKAELKAHQQETEHERTEQEKRSYRAIVKRFAQEPGETPDSLTSEIKNQLLSGMGLLEKVTLTARRLPTTREKVGPPLVLLTFRTLAERALFFSRRKELAGTSWGLDEDLTPAQQQQRRALWGTFIEKRQEFPGVYWRGGDLNVNHRLWRPPPPG